MDMDSLLQRYFGATDPADIHARAVGPAVERMKVDFGLEKDPGKRFALWSLMTMMGDAPDIDVAFKDAAEQEAARNFLDLMAAQQEQPPE